MLPKYLFETFTRSLSFNYHPFSPPVFLPHLDVLGHFASVIDQTFRVELYSAALSHTLVMDKAAATVIAAAPIRLSWCVVLVGGEGKYLSEVTGHTMED